MRSLLLIALFASLAALAIGAGTGCTAIVGDACVDQTDCGNRMYCELSMPQGYCTVKDCVVGGCPEQSVCVRFSHDVSFCMYACESNSDCRDGYRCVTDFGPHAFCNDADGETPAP